MVMMGRVVVMMQTSLAGLKNRLMGADAENRSMNALLRGNMSRGASVTRIYTQVA
jgi:hypothetical protein